MYEQFLDLKVTAFLSTGSAIRGILYKETSKAVHIYVVDDQQETMEECIINKKHILCIDREIKKSSKS